MRYIPPYLSLAILIPAIVLLSACGGSSAQKKVETTRNALIALINNAQNKSVLKEVPWVTASSDLAVAKQEALNGVKEEERLIQKTATFADTEGIWRSLEPSLDRINNSAIQQAYKAFAKAVLEASKSKK